MRTTKYDEELGDMVAAAVPTVDEPTAGELDRVWNRVAADLGDAPVRRRRRLRVLVGAGVAAAVLGTSGIAAAGIFSARTGEGPADAEDLALGGPGERLDPAGSDLASVLAEETEDIPFPTAAVRERVLDFWVDDQQRDNPQPGTTGVSTGALRAWVAQDAVCAWANQWAGATRSGDTAARNDATRMLAAAPSWDAVTALDPKPSTWVESLSIEDENGEVTTEPWRGETHFYYLGKVVTAAKATDLAAMATALRSGGRGCWTHLVPALPMADPMYAEERRRGE